MKIPNLARYGLLRLRAHELLGHVPLHFVGVTELPGGRAGLTMRELMEIAGFLGDRPVPANALARALFRARALVGRLLGWGPTEELVSRLTYVDRLRATDWLRSEVLPGTPRGVFRDLYLFEREYAGELINRTVHAFVVLALEPTAGGYRLVVAVHAAKTGRLTPWYLALIKAPCYWVIYPSVRRGLLRRWRRAAATPRAGRPAHA